ncbi:hypothetical protein GCM10027570_31110 [Streptomonospora sediminis]
MSTDLDTAVEEVRTELGRADSKASMLLALTGAAAAIVATSPLITTETAGAWLARAGLAVLVTAVVVLLLVARPRLRSAPFMHAAAGAWRPETPRERMSALSAVARSKFVRIRLAVDLIVVAVLLIGAGICWEVIS